MLFAVVVVDFDGFKLSVFAYREDDRFVILDADRFQVLHGSDGHLLLRDVLVALQRFRGPMDRHPAFFTHA